MVSIVVFHVLILLLGLGIVSRVVPLERVGYMLGYLHKAIGITAPFPEQVRRSSGSDPQSSLLTDVFCCWC